jgi:prepilin peptidase CpaA
MNSGRIDEMLEYPLFLIFPAAMAFAGSMDIFSMTIPNRIALALIVGFALAFPFSDLGLLGLLSHVAIGALTLFAGFLMFSRGWLGGGDAKLLAAAALWIGPDHMLPFLFLVTIGGGLLSIVLLLFRKLVLPPRLAIEPWVARLHARRGGIPYGVAIAAAGLLVFPHTLWFAALAV